MPLLVEWEERLMDYTGSEQGVLFTMDGKAWRTCRPWGNGVQATLVAQMAGVEGSFVQRAFYNGHYAHHGTSKYLHWR
jgi:hypothetical protein